MLLLDTRPDTGVVPVPQRRRALGASVLLGVAAFAVSVTGSWIPSLWGDEAASQLSARRSLTSLFHMLQHVDAVHGTYYVFLHFWVRVFGYGAFSIRFPSAVAIGVCVGLLVWMCARLTTVRIALLAGVVAAMLPRLTYAGAEARAFSFDAAFAAALCAIVVEIVVRPGPRRRWWVAYGVVLAVATYFFLYTGLMAVAIGAFVLIAPSARHHWRRWLLASAAAFAVAVPLLLLAYKERAQISYLGNGGYVTFRVLFVQMWFGADWFAALAWVLIAAAVAALVLQVRRARRRAADAATRRQRWRTAAADVLSRPDGRPLLTVLALCWLILPVGILVAGSSMAAIFTMRYGTFAAPAAAVLMAVGIDALARRGGRMLVARHAARPGSTAGTATGVRTPARAAVAVATALAAVVVLAAAPIWFQQRTPYAENQSDWNEIAATLRGDARPGDAVVFDDVAQPSRRPRLAMDTAVGGIGPVSDVTLETPYYDNDTWYDKTYTVTEAAERGRFDGVTRVWVVEYDTPASLVGMHRPSRYGMDALEQLGYHEASAVQLHASVVYLFTK